MINYDEYGNWEECETLTPQEIVVSLIPRLLEFVRFTLQHLEDRKRCAGRLDKWEREMIEEVCMMTNKTKMKEAPK